jgi:glutathione S-transferase
MRLFDYNRAPNPRRVRVFIAEKGLEIPLIKVDLMRMQQLSPEFRQINPGATLPVLETDDGTYISESLAICHYLETLHPEPALLGSSPIEKAKVIMWNNIAEQGIDAAAEVLRNVSPGFRGHALPGPAPTEQIPALVQRGEVRVIQFFDRIEQQLASNAYLAGDNFSFADITLMAATEFADWVETHAYATRPALQRWYTEVTARPAANA